MSGGDDCGCPGPPEPPFWWQSINTGEGYTVAGPGGAAGALYGFVFLDAYKCEKFLDGSLIGIGFGAP